MRPTAATEPGPRRPDPAFWAGKRVLLTGQTGFKGGWLALWLERLGAEVTALALPPESGPTLYDLAAVADACDSRFVDLRDAAATRAAVEAARPEIVLHLAAQALVRRSLADPLETFASNVMGTANLLEAVRGLDGLHGLAAVLAATTDKVYANDGSGRPMRESDPLGGKDPYSASKAACEHVIHAYRASFGAAAFGRIGAARGGNVIGGGDFSADRILPDCVRAARDGRPLVLRHPEATRPWQHVLDCLAGYLLYAEDLAAGRGAPALNFGPTPGASLPVRALAEAAMQRLGGGEIVLRPVPGSVEAPALALDPTLARETLGWRDRLVGADAIEAAVRWYAAWAAGADMAARTRAEIAAYMDAARETDLDAAHLATPHAALSEVA